MSTGTPQDQRNRRSYSSVDDDPPASGEASGQGRRGQQQHPSLPLPVGRPSRRAARSAATAERDQAGDQGWNPAGGGAADDEDYEWIRYLSGGKPKTGPAPAVPAPRSPAGPADEMVPPFAPPDAGRPQGPSVPRFTPPDAGHPQGLSVPQFSPPDASRPQGPSVPRFAPPDAGHPQGLSVPGFAPPDTGRPQGPSVPRFTPPETAQPSAAPRSFAGPAQPAAPAGAPPEATPDTGRRRAAHRSHGPAARTGPRCRRPVCLRRQVGSVLDVRPRGRGQIQLTTVNRPIRPLTAGPGAGRRTERRSRKRRGASPGRNY